MLRTLLAPLHWLVIALLVMAVWVTGDACDADMPAAVASSAKPAGEIPAAPRMSVLTEQDWQGASRKPLSAAEIDALVEQELKAGHIEPAALTTDEQFLRRVSLDLTGQFPRPADVIEFVADTDPGKRAKLIDQLLESDDFARHWARYWRDVVSVRITNRRSMGLTRSFEEWLYEQFRDRKDWGQITRAILTAEGELRFSRSVAADSALVKRPGWQEKPTSTNGELFFLVAHDNDEAEERAAETSRVFLGIQIQCAQCHDHFTEPWKRTQFHELAAYFSRIKYQQLFDNKKLSGVQLVTVPEREHEMTSLENPETATVMHPRFLNGQAPDKNLSDLERRTALAEALIDKQNYWFAAAYVNRVWNELMGQSFYRNVDDLGPMKEVIYPEVLTRLTGAFRGTNYDIRSLYRAIANSETYQRKISAGAASVQNQPFAAACSSPLRADVLWDSMERVLGRLGSSQYLTQGGRRFNPSILEGKFKYEFDFDPSLKNEEVKGTIPQALFLMNNADLNKRMAVTRSNWLGLLLKELPEESNAIKQLYLHTLARRPTDRELKKCSAYIAKAASRAEAYEDILWALINSTEFQSKR